MRSMRITRTSLSLVATLLVVVGLASVRLSGELRSTAAESAPPRSPETFARLLEEYDRNAAAAATATNDAQRTVLVERQQELERQIDREGGQRYCGRSRLFWHTDWNAAREAARTSGKPIVSLRLLGKLTDELSCANSRFFRTTLYANDEVSRQLRENFVLHWESVRPAPTVTVDFGDGRKLVRTVTGNSIHYVLTPDGDVVDALPGLYGPSAFLRLVEQAGAAARSIAALPPERRAEATAVYHRQCATEVLASWNADMTRLAGGPQANTPTPRPSPENATSGVAAPRAAANSTANGENPAAPSAERAAGVALPKARVESPLVAHLTGRPRSFLRAVDLERQTTEAFWKRLAELHADDAQLDDSSRDLIASQNPSATAAASRAITKKFVESPLVRMLETLRSSIAEDSIRNQYLLHRQVHEWFVAGTAPRELAALNEKVYAELFLTPSGDPWLGLVPADAYTGLTDNGLVAN